MSAVEPNLVQAVIQAALKPPVSDLPNVIRGDEFLRSIKPSNWIYDGLFVRAYLYALVSPTNHGKTTVAATLVASAISGEDFGRFRNALGRPMKVLLLCGENDVDTGVKLLAAFQHFGISPEQIRENLFVLPASFQMLSGAELVADQANAFGVDFDLCIIDTWQAYWSGGDFNANDSQLDHARALRYFSKRLNGSPACIVPAHPVKNASKDNLVPYGGGAAMNEIDCCLTGWKDGDVFTLHHGKIRQAPFDPAAFQLVGCSLPRLIDRNGQATQSVVALPITDAAAEFAQIKSLSVRDAVLMALFDAGVNRSQKSRRAIFDQLKSRDLVKTENQVRVALDDLRATGYLELGENTLTPKGRREAKNAR